VNQPRVPGRALPEPELTHRFEDGRDIPVLVWRLPEPVLAISSAVLGGGIGPCGWLLNATVPMSYDRDDPAEHLTGIAGDLGLIGPGVGLLTGVDVADMIAGSESGVRLWATVGLGAPVQAAAPQTAAQQAATTHTASHQAADPQDEDTPTVGTVNIVAWVPVRLSAGALVNAVATVTEAKTQAIRELGLEATGTATDAVCVLCPSGGAAADYAGPRSTWGAPLARAAHRAVLDGGAANLSSAQSWSDRVSSR
jgi:adenosylcobinamide hydrolase